MTSGISHPHAGSTVKMVAPTISLSSNYDASAAPTPFLLAGFGNRENLRKTNYGVAIPQNNNDETNHEEDSSPGAPNEPTNKSNVVVTVSASKPLPKAIGKLNQSQLAPVSYLFAPKQENESLSAGAPGEGEITVRPRSRSTHEVMPPRNSEINPVLETTTLDQQEIQRKQLEDWKRQQEEQLERSRKELLEQQKTLQQQQEQLLQLQKEKEIQWQQQQELLAKQEEVLKQMHWQQQQQQAVAPVQYTIQYTQPQQASPLRQKLPPTTDSTVVTPWDEDIRKEEAAKETSPPFQIKWDDEEDESDAFHPHFPPPPVPLASPVNENLLSFFSAPASKPGSTVNSGSSTPLKAKPRKDRQTLPATPDLTKQMALFSLEKPPSKTQPNSRSGSANNSEDEDDHDPDKDPRRKGKKKHKPKESGLDLKLKPVSDTASRWLANPDFYFAVHHADSKSGMGFQRHHVSWRFVLDNRLHELELFHSRFSGKRRIRLDTIELINEKVLFDGGSSHEIFIGQRQLEVLIYQGGEYAGDWGYELMIEGKPFVRAKKLWLQEAKERVERQKKLKEAQDLLLEQKAELEQLERERAAKTRKKSAAS